MLTHLLVLPMRQGPQTRQRIEKTALQLFAEKGIEQATTKHIAAGAGITEGAIYRHFESKDALVRELFATNYRRIALELTEVRDEAPDMRRKVSAMVGFFCHQFEANPHIFRFLLLIQHDQLRYYPADAPNLVQVVCEAIEAGIQSGEIPPQDSAVATAILLGMVTQPAVFKIYGRIHGSLINLSEFLSIACWRVISGEGSKL